MKKIFISLMALIITLASHADFGIYASAVYLNKNGTGGFYNTQKPSDPVQHIGNQDFAGHQGFYAKNSGTLKLNGAEIKTYKNNGGNVCSGTIYYRVYLSGTTPPAFTSSINLPYYADCNSVNPCTSYGGAFIPEKGGGCCNLNDQKWQEATQQVDLTAFPGGDYTLEVYYTSTGEPNSGSCNSTTYDSNNSNNYKVTYTITDPLPVVFGNVFASIKNETLYVRWETERENDVAHYNVLLSTNGNDFTTLGQVKPYHNSGTKQLYFYEKKLAKPASTVFGFILLGFAGFSVLLKRKIAIQSSVVVAFAFMFISFGCNKNEAAIKRNYAKVWVKIVQVENGGNTQESKIVQAKTD